MKSIAALTVSPWLRALCFFSAIFTMSGVGLFAFPDAWPAQVAGLPSHAPDVYRGLVAALMIAFGSLYLWLGAQTRVPSALVVFGAIAKLIAFSAFTLMWLDDVATTRTLCAVSGDLVLALLLLRAVVVDTAVPKYNAQSARTNGSGSF